MAIPFKNLYGARPSVLPQSADAFGQLTRGLMNGFSAGQARAQEDEVPKLAMAAAALGDLMPDGATVPRELTPEEHALLERMLHNPATQAWAMQILEAARG